MLFTDYLYGTVDFRQTPYEDLIFDLLGSPEVQRLRHMRLMNFDVPYIQDLASAKRFPHSIGTCYLAYRTVEKSSLSLLDKKKIIIAALIHDIGILPYGHLLESIFKSKNIDFSHENLVYSILTGSYHRTTKYHQLIGNISLKIHSILKKNGISSKEMFTLINPPKGSSTAISADVDLDNLDNVHRMAMLLGYDKAKQNLSCIAEHISIDNKLQLVFKEDAVAYVEEWLKMRQSIYTMIIGQPECVPYNAFLTKLLSQSIEQKVIAEEDWFITDSQFETLLVEDSATKKLAQFLYVRPQFELIDYIWFLSNDEPEIPLKYVENSIESKNFTKPKDSSFYFFWTEKKLISRKISIKLNDYRSFNLGFNSHSILISLVYESDSLKKPTKISEIDKEVWRNQVYEYMQSMLPNWKFAVKFPEDYNNGIFNSRVQYEQLKLFA